MTLTVILLIIIYLCIGGWLALQVLFSGWVDSVKTLIFIVFCWSYLVMREKISDYKERNNGR